MTIETRLRNIAFQIVFWAGSVPIVLGAPVAALVSQRALVWYVRRWVGFHVWCARALLGVRVRLEGELPAAPVLYVAKHQSMFDAIIVPLLLDAPIIVLKRELADIPVWGWSAKRYGAIPVDREASAKALRQMLREAGAARGAGRSVLIFPEGTRVPPGEQPPLRPGLAGLYRALGYPMVPLANDSGRLWPRKGPKLAGLVTFRFGAPIPPGLPRENAEARAHAAINMLERPIS